MHNQNLIIRIYQKTKSEGYSTEKLAQIPQNYQCYETQIEAEDLSFKVTKRLWQLNSVCDIKICSILFIREIKIKTTMSYHLILIRMATIKSLHKKNTGEGIEKRELSYTTGVDVVGAAMV